MAEPEPHALIVVALNPAAEVAGVVDLANHGATRATQVIAGTADVFISPRQMRRRFLAAVGYGPKELQRILRFNGFMALGDIGRGSAGNAGDVTLAALARLAGYADQAHLSRECARLSGFTPTAFLQRTRSSCGPAHDHGLPSQDCDEGYSASRSVEAPVRRPGRHRP